MTPDALIDYLSRAGPTPTGTLIERLGVAKATLHRARRKCGERILVQGKARATTLAVRRPVDGVPEGPIPVYRVSNTGGVDAIAALQPVEPFGYAVSTPEPSPEAGFHHADPANTDSATTLDLPWFLTDLMPQGYLGRAWLRRHPDLGFPRDPASWSGDDVLRFVVLHGADLPGALLIGATAKAAWLDGRTGGHTLDAGQLASKLPHLAEQSRDLGGASSAGGEQPKITFRLAHADGSITHHIAKFTATVAQAVGRRWADLLVAEHLALRALHSRGVPASQSQIVDAGQRRFLVVARFDRHGARGRSGLTSLLSLDLDGVGSRRRSWPIVTQRLFREGRLTAADHHRTRWLEAFGHAIGNTDMHLGNLSLRLDGLRITGLAPVYDMLPMYYAPAASGELRSEPFDPWAHLEDPPEGVIDAARTYWSTVATDARVSADFQRLAAHQAEALRR